MSELAAGAARPARFERLLGALVVVCLVAAACAAAILVLPATLRITRYDIRGVRALSRDEVLSAALIRGNERFFSVDPARIAAALAADPRIAGARVERLFPNGLRIAIVEREPVATILVETQAGQRLAYLDSRGVAFALAYGGRPGYSPPESLPLVSGVRIEGFRPGVRLPAELASVLAAVGEIQASDPTLLSAFSEIRIARSRYGEGELVLYPLGQRVPVRTGAALSARELRSIILVLDVLGARGLGAGVDEIDFRTGTVVYRNKEGDPD